MKLSVIIIIVVAVMVFHRHHRCPTFSPVQPYGSEIEERGAIDRLEEKEPKPDDNDHDECLTLACH